mgnify:CR=1 FL=1
MSTTPSRESSTDRERLSNGKDVETFTVSLWRPPYQVLAETDGLDVRNRKRDGMSHADRTDGSVRRGSRAELGGVLARDRAGAEHLALRGELDVDFESDHRLVTHTKRADRTRP